MKPTPRTDAASQVIGPIAGSGVELIEADVARQLERENTVLLEALSDLCKCLAPTDAHVAAIGKRLGPSLQGKLIHARRVIAKAKGDT